VYHTSCLSTVTYNLKFSSKERNNETPGRHQPIKRIAFFEIDLPPCFLKESRLRSLVFMEVFSPVQRSAAFELGNLFLRIAFPAYSSITRMPISVAT
jgi:hypothetical protein